MSNSFFLDVDGNNNGSLVFNIASFGAVANNTSTSVGIANKAAISAAIAAAIAVKGTVYIPSGRFFINSLFTNITGTFSIVGEGSQSEIYCVESAPNNNDRRIINITDCIGGTFKNFKVSSDAIVGVSTRSTQAWGLGFFNSSHCKIEGVTIEKTYAAGLMFRGCSFMDVVNNFVSLTCADSIHMTDGSTDMTVARNKTSDCGDDGIAVVSYLGQTNYCERILIHNNIIDKSWARGITVVGGKKVTITNNIITNSCSSGILTAFETANPTKDVFDVIITGNQLYKAGYYVTAIPTTGSHIGIEISSGTDIMVNENNVISSLGRGIQINDTKTKRIKVINNNVKFSGSTGIWTGTVKGIEIIGNTMTMNKQQGLAMTGTKDAIVNSNTLRNNNFWDKDSEITTLSGGIDAAVTSLTFASGTNFTMAAPFTIVIDLEQMSVTAFDTTTGIATVTRAQGGTTAVAHQNGTAISSGAMTVSIDNALILNCININIEGNQSLEDWSVAVFPDTNINNVDTVPVVKKRIERSIEFNANTRFRVLGNTTYTDPTRVTTLTAGIDNVVTSLTFASGTNFVSLSVPFSIIIDAEQMSVTAFNSSTGVATVTRAQSATTAAAHSTGAAISSTNTPSSSVFFGSPNTNADGLRDNYTGTTIPTDTAYRAGQEYYKTDTKEIYKYSGTAWHKTAVLT